MHDRFHFRQFLHERQMQLDFRRHFALAGNLFAVHVDDAQVVRGHKPFGNHRRGADDFVLIQTIRNVAVVAGGEPLFINTVTDIADFFFDLFQHGF